MKEEFNQSDMSVGTSSRRKTVKLPSTDIPKFSGKLTEWPTFLNSFEASIDTCSDLDDVQRLANLPNISSDSNLTEIRKFY